MPVPTCTFDLVNRGQREMFIYLEPEGSEFILPPGKALQVKLFGESCPIEMQCSDDADGRRQISFWSAKGSYELFFEGTDVWDLL